MNAASEDITNRQLLASLSEILSVITDNMVTKEEAGIFAAKDDLKGFATKSDLNNLEARLTRRLDDNQKVQTRHFLEVRQDIGNLNRQLTHMREGLARAAR